MCGKKMLLEPKDHFSRRAYSNHMAILKVVKNTPQFEFIYFRPYVVVAFQLSSLNFVPQPKTKFHIPIKFPDPKIPRLEKLVQKTRDACFFAEYKNGGMDRVGTL